MQTRSLCCVPDPGLIYIGGCWLYQSLSGFAPLDGEKKPGLVPADVSEFKITGRVAFTVVISVGHGNG